MSAKLFVGNLDFTVTSDDLRAFFEKVTKVSDAVVIMDRMTNRSRGFGFVEVASEEDAQEAIKKINGTELKGRKINVNVARPQTDR